MGVCISRQLPCSNREKTMGKIRKAEEIGIRYNLLLVEGFQPNRAENYFFPLFLGWPVSFDKRLMYNMLRKYLKRLLCMMPAWAGKALHLFKGQMHRQLFLEILFGFAIRVLVEGRCFAFLWMTLCDQKHVLRRLDLVMSLSTKYKRVQSAMAFVTRVPQSI